MMLLADFPQMAVAGKHLGATQYGLRRRNGVSFQRPTAADQRAMVAEPM
jgi:hypothetical protein